MMDYTHIKEYVKQKMREIRFPPDYCGGKWRVKLPEVYCNLRPDGTIGNIVIVQEDGNELSLKP